MADSLKAGSIVWEGEFDNKKFKEGLKSVAGDLNSLKDQLNKTGSFVKGLGAVFGVSLGVEAITQKFKEVIGAAKEFDQAMIGLARTAGRFGQDTQLANEAAKSLATDGLITISTAASGLQKLMVAGLGLPEAIELMKGYKDQAAFGRASTLSMDEAVNNLAESFYTENSAIGNLSGQTENWNMILEKGAAIMGKSTSQLSQQERVLAKLYGQRELNKIVEGDANKVSETTAGTLSKLSTQYLSLSATIGQALAPAVQMIAQLMSGVLSRAIVWVQSNFQNLQVAAITIGGVLVGLGNIIAGVAKSIFYFMTGNWTKIEDVVLETIGNIGNVVTTTQDKIVKTVANSYSEQDDIVENSANNQVEIQTEKQKKLAKQLAEENQSFEDANKKREKSFKENLAELIWAHQDKVKDIQNQLDEEIADFKKASEEVNADYKEAMAEMVKDHEKSVAKIQKQIDKNNQDTKEKNSEILKEAEQEIEEETALHEKKILTLEDQLAREIAKGKNASKTKIANLKLQIEEETLNYEAKVAEINALAQKEVDDNKKKNDEKIADLNESIAEENATFEEQKAKKTTDLEEETAKLKIEHDKRVSDYNDALSKENEILKAHTSDVESVKNMQKETDIARLKRQFDEENAEALKQHNKKLKDLRDQGASEGANYGSGFAGGLESQKNKMAELARQIAEETGKSLHSDNSKNNAKEAGKNILKNFANGILDSARSIFEKFNLPDVPGIIGDAFRTLRNIPYFANGVKNFSGGLAVVGELGPEIVQLPRGSNVIPNKDINKSMGGQTINMYIDKVRDYQDIQQIGREMGFRANILPSMG